MHAMAQLPGLIVVSTGEPDRPPVKVGVAATDIATGLYAHGAIMAALISRQQTGKGIWIDCNLFETQVYNHCFPKLHTNMLVDCRSCKYCVKLPDCWQGSVAAWHFASFNRPLPGPPMQGWLFDDRRGERETGTSNGPEAYFILTRFLVQNLERDPRGTFPCY